MADGPVLITGGAGFIGSHLTDALLAKGHSVRILDD
ncbi:MAG: NAD-dependent epimerase/dehydratase family protein, partial [Pseudomonas sp.]